MEDEKIICIDRTYDFRQSDIYSEIFVLDDSFYNYEYTHKFPNTTILDIPEKFQKDLKVFNRFDVEWNNNYQQIVVCLIVRNKNNFMFLDCLSGDMSSNITMIEGHVKYNENHNDMMMNTVLYENMIREFNEEVVINFSKVNKKDIGAFNNFKLKYVAWNNSTSTSISYRHIGFIYELDLSNTKYPISKTIFQSGEPDVNKLHFVDITKIKPNDYNYFDSWTREILVYNQYLLNHKQ